ncbi:MAG: hypothetical protein B6I22_06275 [Desulfobacteraceae bacterium 4572_123]|nr:MAG: hypothetical protein B6I22_06275 [Desulfobacteraceae bacterium 4572_123]
MCVTVGMSIPCIFIFVVISQRPSFILGLESPQEIEIAAIRIIDAANSFFIIGKPLFFSF